jgi:dolichol-phosphate mannosyltransferase
VNLSRNFGHQVAISAGLDHSRGQIVAIMDADLQDPPEVLLRFIEKWRQGYAVVYAVRKQRKEGFLKRSAYALFYRTFHSIAEIEVPLDAGDFCLLDRCVVDVLVALPEHHRFLRGLRSWVGFKQIGIEYDRDERYGGKSKYSLWKLVQLALSGYVGFSSLPLRAATWCGFFSAGVGFMLILWALATKLLEVSSPHGWTSTIAAILFVGGVQLLMLGIIGEYLGRVYDEVRQRPLYIVQSRLGFAADNTHRVALGLAKTVRQEPAFKL